MDVARSSANPPASGRQPASLVDSKQVPEESDVLEGRVPQQHPACGAEERSNSIRWVRAAAGSVCTCASSRERGRRQRGLGTCTCKPPRSRAPAAMEAHTSSRLARTLAAASSCCIVGAALVPARAHAPCSAGRAPGARRRCAVRGRRCAWERFAAGLSYPWCGACCCIGRSERARAGRSRKRSSVPPAGCFLVLELMPGIHH